MDVGKVLTISSQDRTKNNRFKLEKCRFNKEIGRNWFTNRVVDDWNRLSQQVVSAQTIGSFKRRLDDLRNIRMAFHFQDKDMMRKIITTMTRPKLEYAEVI